jgi:S1-C subfamily serine protease
MEHPERDDTPRTDAVLGADAGAEDGRRPRPVPQPDGSPAARTLPHVTGGSDARYVSATRQPLDDGHQSYDAAPSSTVPPTFAGPAAASTPADGRRRPRRWLALTGAAAAVVLVAGGAGAGAWAVGHTAGEVAAASAAAQRQALELAPQLLGPRSGSSGSSGSSDGFLPGGSAQGGTGTAESSAVPATAEETAGVVTIVSTLNYDESYKSAGTGMVLTANGLVLTNNHVVQGSTSIQVTDETTGITYTADVVGTDATNDVAVLQLRDASGLTPVSVDDSGDVAAGDAVHSTGNAGGTGDLVTATGTVLATDQSIQVQSESGSGTESLSGLIEVQSDVVSGDSGGPLRDGSGDVVGIVTAASSGSTPVTGYAIPIDDALDIARQIESGTSSSTVQIGLPAFLGAEIANTATGGAAGVPIAGTVSGSAAESAGLVAGDVVTALDGTPVTSAEALTAAVTAHASGDRVTVTWTDASGTSRTATVTLGDGPAA